MEKNGHWYTDKNGQHYFVENGQSPKEGWEASNRRKMLKNGKYNVSEDGVNYKEVSEDEYRKFEADEDFDIDDVDSVRDFDEEDSPERRVEMIAENINDYLVNEELNRIRKYCDKYGEDYEEVINHIAQGIEAGQDPAESMEEVLDDIVSGRSGTVPQAQEKESDTEITDEDISQALDDESWKTDDLEELAEIVASTMKVDKERVMSVINKEKDEGTEEDKLWDKYEKGEITDKEKEKLNSERQKKLSEGAEENQSFDYKNKSIDELDREGFEGWHNVLINNLRESAYDTAEEARSKIKPNWTERQKAYVNAYINQVFGKDEESGEDIKAKYTPSTQLEKDIDEYVKNHLWQIKNGKMALSDIANHFTKMIGGKYEQNLDAVLKSVATRENGETNDNNEIEMVSRYKKIREALGDDADETIEWLFNHLSRLNDYKKGK